MIRKIIEIDKEKCNGCGLCAHALSLIHISVFMNLQYKFY